MERLSKAQIKAIVNGEQSKSQKVIELGKAGYEVKEIYEILKNILPRYQMAFNVWSNYCRTNGIERATADKSNTKKSKIIALLEEGKTPVEISKELQCNYNMVYKVRKDWEIDQRNAKAKTEATEATA